MSYLDVDGVNRPYITANELEALSIRRGSLSEQERVEIESHVTHTFQFLSQIPWTGEFARVPEIAFAHHEKLDGTGYPRRLKAADIPLQSRMMTISDIFDALVAWDRPYKKAVPVEKALDILHDEAKQGKLDVDLLQVFIEAKVYELTARRAAGNPPVDDPRHRSPRQLLGRAREHPRLLRKRHRRGRHARGVRRADDRRTATSW